MVNNNNFHCRIEFDLKEKKNNGIRARCIEFFNLEITKNANHAENIGDFVNQNCRYYFNVSDSKLKERIKMNLMNKKSGYLLVT